MRKLLFVLTFYFTTPLLSQDSPENNKLVIESPVSASVDSAAQLLEIRDNKENLKNILALTEQIEKRREKEKKMAMLRIAVGVLFLAVLVVGLMRRRKK